MIVALRSLREIPLKSSDSISLLRGRVFTSLREAGADVPRRFCVAIPLPSRGVGGHKMFARSSWRRRADPVRLCPLRSPFRSDASHISTKRRPPPPRAARLVPLGKRSSPARRNQAARSIRRDLRRNSRILEGRRRRVPAGAGRRLSLWLSEYYGVDRGCSRGRGTRRRPTTPSPRDAAAQGHDQQIVMPGARTKRACSSRRTGGCRCPAHERAPTDGCSAWRP